MQMQARPLAKALFQGLLASSILLLPSVSMAVLQDEIQVYDDEINAKGCLLYTSDAADE